MDWKRSNLIAVVVVVGVGWLHWLGSGYGNFVGCGNFVGRGGGG